jgi:hypothetical protein
MAAFEAMCEGYLGISAHWHLFRYFFMFACLKGWPQGGNDRLRQPSDEVRPGRQLHSILPDQLEQQLAQGVVLPKERPRVRAAAFTGNSIRQSQSNWTHGQPQAEQEKMLKEHWAVLGRLRGAGVTLATVIGQYHARVVLLRRRSLRPTEPLGRGP